MNVVFLCRPDVFENPGGDSVQILETKRNLESRGVRITIVSTADMPTDEQRRVVMEADLVHCFNLLLSFQYRELIAVARRAGRKLILSPIYWDLTRFERRSGCIPRWKKLTAAMCSRVGLPPVRGFFERHAKTVTYNDHYRRSLMRILKEFDIVLPNSHAEARILADALECGVESAIVVNGCRVVEDATPEVPAEEREFVLCVGRIEHRKNQVQLIRALSGTGRRLVLIGNINEAEHDYWKLCEDEARRHGVVVHRHSNMSFGRLWNYYRSASVHVQPSWFETPGLSSLEAASAGCRIVCTAEGSAREYFGELAQYCDPESSGSIREAIERSMAAAHDGTVLAARVRDAYTWEHAAAQTVATYHRLTGGC